MFFLYVRCGWEMSGMFRVIAMFLLGLFFRCFGSFMGRCGGFWLG